MVTIPQWHCNCKEWHQKYIKPGKNEQLLKVGRERKETRSGTCRIEHLYNCRIFEFNIVVGTGMYVGVSIGQVFSAYGQSVCE